jgi:hypothetical protein
MRSKWSDREGAWDVNGAALFSRPFGYLEKGYDFDKSIQNTDKTID